MSKSLVPLSGATTGPATLMTIAVLATIAIGCGNSGEPGSPDPSRPEALAVQPDSIALEQVDSLIITVSVLDQYGAVMGGQPVSFLTLDPQLVQVSQAGTAKSLGVPGLGTIRVTSASLSMDIPVSIARTPSQIVVAPGSLRLFPNETQSLTPTLLDAVGNPVAGAVFTYAIAGTGLSVDPTGLVSAGSAPATALVTVSHAGLSQAVPVAVPTHPVGGLHTLHLTGSSWGLAISGQGSVYFTRPESGDPAVFRSSIPLQNPSAVADGFVGSAPLSLAVNSSGSRVVAPDLRGHTVSIINTSTDNVTTVSSGLGGALLVAGIGADDSLAWIGTDLNRLYVVDIVRGRVIDTVAVFGPCNAMAFSRGEPLLYASLYTGGRVAEINTSTRTLLRTFQVGGNPQGLDVSPDGKELYIAAEDSNVIKIWDLQADTLLTAIPLAGSPFGLALSPDGTQIWVTRSGTVQEYRLEIYDRLTRSFLTGYDLGPGVARRIAFNLAGTTAVITNDGTRIHFVN